MKEKIAMRVFTVSCGKRMVVQWHLDYCYDYRGKARYAGIGFTGDKATVKFLGLGSA